MRVRRPARLHRRKVKQQASDGGSTYMRRYYRKGFELVEKRFEQIETRIEDIMKAMQRFVYWTFGFIATASGIVIVAIRLL